MASTLTCTCSSAARPLSGLKCTKCGTVYTQRQYDAAEPWGGQGEAFESERDEINEEEGGASIGGASSSGRERQANHRSVEEGKSAEGNYDGPSDGREGMREESEETGGSGGRSSGSSKPGKQSGGGVDPRSTGGPSGEKKKRTGRNEHWIARTSEYIDEKRNEKYWPWIRVNGTIGGICDEACTAFVDNHQVYCLYCSEVLNANVDRVAFLLGVPRLFCIPHGLHHVFKAVASNFPIFSLLTHGVTSLMRSGGGFEREQAVVKAGLSFSSLKSIETRWGTTMDTCDYLLKKTREREEEDGDEDYRGVNVNFHVFRDEVLTSKAWATASAAPTEEARVLGNKRPVKTLLAALHKHAEPSVHKDDRLHYAEAELRLVSILLKDFLKLLRSSMTSPQNATGSATPYALNRDLGLFRGDLRFSGTSAGVDQVFIELWTKMSVTFNDLERAALRKKYEPLIVRACAAGVQRYDNFIPKALEMLQQRLRWDPSIKPTRVPSNILNNIDKLSTYFGTFPDAYQGALVRYWNTYVDIYDTLPSRLTSLPAIKFWQHKDLRQHFSDDFLALAQWYANMPSSNATAEGIFGVMRTIESDQRFSLKTESIDEELKAKINGWILDPLIAAAAFQLRRVSVKRPKSPSPGSGGGGADTDASASDRFAAAASSGLSSASRDSNYLTHSGGSSSSGSNSSATSSTGRASGKPPGRPTDPYYYYDDDNIDLVSQEVQEDALREIFGEEDDDDDL